MTRLLTILSLILALALFPPATLALISNNAVPGDTTYPVKRSLEDVIFAIASLNPVTKAWFAKARSDRRFKEFSTLVAQGKSASNTLNELVMQTEAAASEIKNINDPIRKQQLINQLSQSIDKYDQKLEEVSQISQAARPEPTQRPEVSSIPVATPIPAAPTPRQTVTPKPSVASTSPPTPAVNPEETEEAKKKLEEIKKKLEEEAKRLQQQPEERRQVREREDSDRGEDKEERNKDSNRSQKSD